MPDNMTTYEAISPRTKGHAVRRLLKNGKALMVLEKFGQVDPQPANQTKTRKYRRYLPLPLATAPLSEGISPPGSQLQHEDVECTLEQFGDKVRLSDIVYDTHEDPVLNQTTQLQGVQAAETIETLRWTTLRAGTNVQLANNVATRLLVNNTVGRGDLRKMSRFLKRNRAMEISKILRASANIATDPCLPAFFGLTHTDAESDCKGLPGFIDPAHYSQDAAQPGEFGKCENVRMIGSVLFTPFLQAATSVSSTTWLSNGVAPSAGAAPDVYVMLVVGADAYAVVPFAGKNAVTMYVVNPKAQVGDELAQQGFASWKTLQATCILAQFFMIRYEFAVTANPTN